MRKRHMVDISDAAWEKLGRVAQRLDAAQYVYKGRPRYGKLIELAIEKLEDSTMEWTIEEVWVDGNGNDATGELESILLDDGPLPIDEYYMQAAQDMVLYGNSYIGTDYAKESDFPAISKPIKVNAVSFENMAYSAGKASESTEKLAESFKLQEQIAQGFVENLGKKMNDAFLSGMNNVLAGKPDPATIYEADVWTVPFTTKAGTLITLKARTDKQWTEEQTTLIQNAVYKVVAGSATFYSPFHVSFVGGTGFYEYAAVLDVNPKLAKWTEEKAKKALKAILVEKGLSGTKQLKLIDEIKAEYEAKKPAPPAKLKVYTHGLSHGVSSVTISGELSQALSGPQQVNLRIFALSVALEYVVNKLEFGDKSIDCKMKNTPWNKLSIEIVFPFDVVLKSDLQTIGNAVRDALETWLLQGNFIGPLAKDLNIPEKHKPTF